MPSSSTLRILGSRIDAVTEEEAITRVQKFLGDNRPHHIVTGNTLMVLEAEHDTHLQSVLENASLVLPESSGILWASRRLGQPLPSFTPGIDFMLDICAAAETLGSSIYLLGSAPGVVEQAAAVLKHQFPNLNLVGMNHGYFSKDEEPLVLQQIQATHPAILFAGLGMPRQEKWIAEHLQEFGASVIMGVGGSFDVLSGHLKRAPAFMRKLGVEWFYRLLQEPWRWRRIAQLPLFACKILKARRFSYMPHSSHS